MYVHSNGRTPCTSCKLYYWVHIKNFVGEDKFITLFKMASRRVYKFMLLLLDSFILYASDFWPQVVSRFSTHTIEIFSHHRWASRGRRNKFLLTFKEQIYVRYITLNTKRKGENVLRLFMHDWPLSTQVVVTWIRHHVENKRSYGTLWNNAFTALVTRTFSLWTISTRKRYPVS